jgi:hypothetical protein
LLDLGFRARDFGPDVLWSQAADRALPRLRRQGETMTAQLWIAGPLPGLNELIAAAKGAGGRGMRYAKLKKAWTDTVWALARQARVPAFPGRVSLRFEWLERDRRRDPDNVAAGGRKLILDGLVAAGVLKGDGWRFVDVWSDSFGMAAAKPLHDGTPGCLVTLSNDGATVPMA